MGLMRIRWNAGMTVATLLLLVGGAVLLSADDMGSPLYRAGVGILASASVVYLGARIWMMTRKKDR